MSCSTSCNATKKTSARQAEDFFGASAGVGKTYAMLQAARRRHDEGADVLVGIAETHGRTETAALLDGLDVLPLAHIEYRAASSASSISTPRWPVSRH